MPLLARLGFWNPTDAPRASAAAPPEAWDNGESDLVTWLPKNSLPLKISRKSGTEGSNSAQFDRRKELLLPLHNRE
jgi:hypothetical protein